MVTKPLGLRPDPKPIEPPTMVSGNASTSLPDGSDVANKDRSKDNKFKLPDKVTTQEIRDGSFRYGGGRSAGNRSLADNMLKKVIEP